MDRNDSDDEPLQTSVTGDIVKNEPNASGHPTPSLQFTTSNRGALQSILNRYIYSLFSTSHNAGVRRWRCVDYHSKLVCPAYIITKGNTVLSRNNLHNHPYHDKKILQKVEKNSVYSAIEEVQGVVTITKDYRKRKPSRSDDMMGDTN